MTYFYSHCGTAEEFEGFCFGCDYHELSVEVERLREDLEIWKMRAEKRQEVLEEKP